jgi:hypothetical protein
LARACNFTLPLKSTTINFTFWLAGNAVIN